MIRAFPTWQPAASIVTSTPARSRAGSNSGMPAISFEPSGTEAVPSTSRFSAAQAATTVRHPVAVFRLAARLDLPENLTVSAVPSAVGLLQSLHDVGGADVWPGHASAAPPVPGGPAAPAPAVPPPAQAVAPRVRRPCRRVSRDVPPRP